jgi:predicted double-glycine peptidase
LCALLPIACGCTPGAPAADRPTSYLALRYEATERQKKDFTCGAASLSTIFNYYWQTPISEADVLIALKDRYTKEQMDHITEFGLSFDDLIFVAEKFGFSAIGAKVAVNQLPEMAGPVIVHLDAGVLKHFVVLRKVGDGVYYISDPVTGQVAMHANEFEAQYTGNALAIWKSGADLPIGTKLTSPRDGIRVSDSLWRQINVPNLPLNKGL